MLFAFLAGGLGSAARAQQLPVTLRDVPIHTPTKEPLRGIGATAEKSLGGTHHINEIIPPENGARYPKDRPAAIRLGKALFWDMQLGSDGKVACASCHFHAGTDDRATNTVNRGAGGTFQIGGPNASLKRSDFPFRKLANPDDRLSAVISDADDVVGAQGVTKTRFERVVAGDDADVGQTEVDRVFHRSRRNVRQVTGRNAPTVINAVFTFANFWDGRANHFFNGVNPFGPQDPGARVWVDDGAGLKQELMLLSNSSLASQAVGPPGNDVEMSWAGRSFPEIGRKMLSLTPLAKQVVHPTDSVLGAIARSRLDPDPKAPKTMGLDATYADMIRAAFAPRFWQSTQRTPDGFTQMEANFSLFFGLAVQLYESTLVSDDTPFDRFRQGDPLALTQRQLDGMNVFFGGKANCFACHIGPELTGATMTTLLDPDEAGLIEVMPMGDNQLGNYDVGFYNIGVRPTGEDVGRGGQAPPFGNPPLPSPLSLSCQTVLKAGLAPVGSACGGAIDNLDPKFIPTANCIPDPFAVPPLLCPPTTQPRAAADGAFKTPSLRNVELTGPYFHNGGQLTLTQVVEFYDRGGDFNEANIANLDPFIRRLNLTQAEVESIVDFLLALTDERVRQESAPFDHPQLFVAEGHSNAVEGNPKRHRGAAAATAFREIPAVGAAGRAAQGVEPVGPFLWDGTPDFHFKTSF